MAIRAVLFDLDGTLWTMGPARNDWAHITAKQAVMLEPHFNSLGFAFDRTKFVTRFFVRMGETLSPATADCSEPSWYPVLESVLGELGHSCERSDATRILDVLNGVPFTDLGIAAYPDAGPALVALKTMGIKVGAVTNNPKPDYVLAEQARSLGLPDVFDVIVSSWELGWRKPHRIPFETALKALGVRPEEAAHVGDSWENDVVPALELGMTAVFRRNGAAPDRPGAHHIDSLAELLPLLFPANPERIGDGSASPLPEFAPD